MRVQELIEKSVLAQVNMHVGNFEFNLTKLIEFTQRAIDQGKELIVFPELAICGYPPRDFLEFDDFIAKCWENVQLLLPFSNKIAIIVGCPTKNPNKNGKKLHNSALFLANGEIKGQYAKRLLPNYDVFDEYRYFESGNAISLVNYKNLKIALSVCEDIWNTPDQALYGNNPVDDIAAAGADLIINIAASPFDVNQELKRYQVIQHHFHACKIPLMYCNYVGAQTELIFDGGSMMIDAHGNICTPLVFFKEGLIAYTNPAQNSLVSHISKVQNNAQSLAIGKIYQALILGIQDYFAKLNFKKALVGLSGGIDSAVTYALACEALGAENVYGVLMPSQYSSDHSIKDAEVLVQNYQGNKSLIAIEDLYQGFERALSPLFVNTQKDLTEENLQARIRGVILMAIANKFGYILLNTSNKSEAAVGYGTLYGDMCGGLSVLGDVYKTAVFDLARYINRNEEKIPVNSIIKPPSAELRPDQKDSDSLPDYGLLDQILHLYIEERKGPKQIKSLGFNTDLVDKTLRLVNLNEYKRYQTPPILRVSHKAFGMGRRLPIVAKYLN